MVSDVYDAAVACEGQRFDVAYIGIGALVWLPDIPRSAEVVASLLAPGGFLYLVERHPSAQVPGEDSLGLAVARDYFDGSPEVTERPHADTDGLRIEFLHEFGFDAFGR